MQHKESHRGMQASPRPWTSMPTRAVCLSLPLFCADFRGQMVRVPWPEDSRMDRNLDTALAPEASSHTSASSTIAGPHRCPLPCPVTAQSALGWGGAGPQKLAPPWVSRACLLPCCCSAAVSPNKPNLRTSAPHRAGRECASAPSCDGEQQL